MDTNTAQKILDYCLLEGKEAEKPWCEFKSNFHSSEEIGQDISAIGNICRVLNRIDGFIIFGIDPDSHLPIGTNFDPMTKKGKGNEDLIPWLHRSLGGNVQFEFIEILNYRGSYRMILCQIQSANITPISFQDISYIRVGTYTKPLKSNQGLEGKLWESLLLSSFDTDIAISRLDDHALLDLIDWKGYCEVMDYEPISSATAIEKLIQDNLIIFHDGLYDVTNACALLYARDLDLFHLKNYSPRVITYRGINKLHATNDMKGTKGFALSFSGLINYVISQIPKIENINTTRISEPNYPKVALREFIANAIIHQDFRSIGSEVLIEIYDDRIEISNPGVPLIEIDRFLDHPPKSRNEMIANFMRRAGHCEQRGSGVDRAMASLQVEKLPNPKIDKSTDFTRVILYRTKSIAKLTNEEKAQAIYWHCVLTFILNDEPMTNESVCERFGIEKQNSATASRLIKIAVDAGKIKPFDPNSNTRKHRKYLPIWAN